MAQVPAMCALEVGDPVALLVLAVSDDASLHFAKWQYGDRS
jgi:hypothetical protein